MNDTVRLSHDDWKSVIREQGDSGQTILDFCRERNLQVHCFHYHKRKIREDSSGPGFRELPLARSGALRLVREEGRWCVEVRPGFDPALLEQIMRVLE